MAWQGKGHRGGSDDLKAVPPTRQGMAGQGRARRGVAWQGKARDTGAAAMTSKPFHQRGAAGLGPAWQGEARQGKARQGRLAQSEEKPMARGIDVFVTGSGDDRRVSIRIGGKQADLTMLELVEHANELLDQVLAWPLMFEEETD